MNSSYYRRQLQQKREQQAVAEKKAGEARRKEAVKRADAAKSRSVASKSKSASTVRSRLRDADRSEDASNMAAKEAGRWQIKAAGFAKDAAALQERLAKAEQSEAAAAERERKRAAEVVDQRLSAAEGQFRALRELRPPKVERLRVLMLAASPEGDLRVAREQSRIRRAIESALHRDLVDLEARPSATSDDLLDGLSRFRPHVVHFSGHGDERLVAFEDDVDQQHHGVVVRASTFASALAALEEPPLLVVLNSCHSASQIDPLVAGVVPFAIGMSDEVDDVDAINYAARSYASIANGASLREAHALGQVAVELAGGLGNQLPRLAYADDVDPGAAILLVPPGSNRRGADVPDQRRSGPSSMLEPST